MHHQSVFEPVLQQININSFPLESNSLDFGLILRTSIILMSENVHKIPAGVRGHVTCPGNRPSKNVKKEYHLRVIDSVNQFVELLNLGEVEVVSNSREVKNKNGKSMIEFWELKSVIQF